ncbi:dihydrolipoamide acetyltransferase family protein [Bacillus piscicola]|uniref:dihydrolipoamide acetyltransferase family protein n=1 Tax=Bacillus piscicola TaxID=1632684 RepID=UPI001F09E04E|nr:dihydrolipoamide acetyltransferase family protein [Bacillus piscicola]
MLNEDQQTDAVNKYNRVLAAPYTRKIARDYGVKLEEVAKAIAGDTVREKDIYQFLRTEQQVRRPQQQEMSSQEQPKENEINEGDDLKTIPFTKVRQHIAKKMTQSLYTIPHVTHWEEVDMSAISKLRTQMKKDQISISAAAFFVKATVVALKEFPVFNAVLDEEEEVIHLKTEYHIGLAVDTKKGLMVPVLKHADQKSLSTIHREMKELNAKTKDGKLTPRDLSGSTMTISNVGPLGSTGATPIINYPETALVSFHQTKKRAVVTEEDEIVIRPMMNLSMSFDHRVADGGTAVAFTNRLKELLENPTELWQILV